MLPTIHPHPTHVKIMPPIPQSQWESLRAGSDAFIRSLSQRDSISQTTSRRVGDATLGSQPASHFHLSQNERSCQVAMTNQTEPPLSNANAPMPMSALPIAPKPNSAPMLNKSVPIIGMPET